MSESPGPGSDRVVAAYAAAAKRHGPHALAGPALRTRSFVIRDVFTEAAADRSLRYQELRNALDTTGAPPPAMLKSKNNRRWTAALARVMAASALDEDDRRRALMLYDAMVEEGGPEALDADHQTVYAQLLFLTGARDRCARLLPSLRRLPELVAHYVRCDLANPFTQSALDSEQWTHLLNSPFLEASLEPIEFSGDGAPFDRMTCEPREQADSDTLVSVIMTAFQPDAELLASVGSIVNQSWDDLELLIIDDASGPDYERWFDQCLALDPRIRLIRQDVNRGTYVARNAGLDAAGGAFVTFQDSDDWSHPRRIERQVMPFLHDPDTVATCSLAVRARSDLTHQWLGYPAQRVNASSLMFRRAPVMDRIGYFDSIRKGADTEYALRLQAAFGREIEDVKEPLAYTRLQDGSLSRSDFSLGWAASARIAHQAAYQHWHRDIAAGGRAHVPRTELDRPFPAPATMLDGAARAPGPRRHFDVILVDDWQQRRGPFDSACDEMAALTEAGLVVGVAHTESPGAMTSARRNPATPIQELINDGVVDRVLLDETVSTSLLIVRDPIVLQFPPSEPPKVHADRALVVVGRAPREYPGLGYGYDPSTVSRNARDMFGIEPEWAVTDESFRDPVGAIHVLRSPVDPGRWRADTGIAPPRRPPVVGAYSSDVSSSEVARAVLTGGSLMARATRRARRAIPSLVGAATQKIVSYESRDGRSWLDYLQSLDIITCFPSRDERVAPVEVIVRALAADVVVVAPYRFRDVFGDSVVCSRPAGAIRAISRYRDPDRYRAQAERGRSYVRDLRSPEQYVTKIKSLIAAQPVSPESHQG